jgi:hypothetical protein
MPNTPRQNIALWDELSEIYYYSYFITTWISFNSWYNYAFAANNFRNDREVLNHVKNHNNPAKTIFLSLLQGTNQEAVQFRENIGQLHYCLQNHNISNEEQRIWFENFVVELDRTNLIIDDNYNGIRYHVEITINNGAISNVLATVLSSTNVNLLVYRHTGFDLGHLRLNTDFQRKLSQVQKNFLEGCLNTANPKKPISLLTTANPPNCIEVGQFRLIHDGNVIYKAVMEMLYSLRNLLFHGELTPSNNANKVYEAAYRILKQIVEGLK